MIPSRNARLYRIRWRDKCPDRFAMMSPERNANRYDI